VLLCTPQSISFLPRFPLFYNWKLLFIMSDEFLNIAHPNICTIHFFHIRIILARHAYKYNIYTYNNKFSFEECIYTYSKNCQKFIETYNTRNNTRKTLSSIEYLATLNASDSSISKQFVIKIYLLFS